MFAPETAIALLLFFSWDSDDVEELKKVYMIYYILVFIIGPGASGVSETGGFLGSSAHIIAEFRLGLVTFNFLCLVFYPVSCVYIHPEVTLGKASFLGVLGASALVSLVIMCVLLVSLVLVHILPIYQEILDPFHFCGHSRILRLECRVCFIIRLDSLYYSFKVLVCVVGVFFFDVQNVKFLDIFNRFHII